MMLKKMLVTGCALILSSAAFAFPAPPDDTNPMAPVLEPYTEQLENMKKTFDEQVLPPLKGLLKIANDFGNSTQPDLTPAQEAEWNQYQTKLSQAFLGLVSPVVAQVDMKQVNEEFKKICTTYNLPFQEMTKENFTDVLVGVTAMSALAHFQETNKLSDEELELAMMLFFPQDDPDEEDAQ